MDKSLNQPERPSPKKSPGRFLRALEGFVEGVMFCLQLSERLADGVAWAARGWTRAVRGIGVVLLAIASVVASFLMILDLF